MNIAITNYCNLNCPYCFANKFIDSEKQSLNENQLDKILDFLFYSKLNKYKYRIGIIGGEPTLHPQFQDIVNKIVSICNKYVLFDDINISQIRKAKHLFIYDSFYKPDWFVKILN